MTHIPDIEPILDSWLAEGTDVLPDRSVAAVLLTVERTSQRRALRLPWRTSDMNGYSRLAAWAGTALVVVLVAGGLIYIGGSQGPSVGGGVGPSPSPAPTPSMSPTPSGTPTATDPLDTSIWTTFDSQRYGFSIAHPRDWSESPGKSDWDPVTDAEAWVSEAPDKFCSPDRGDGVVCVSAWSATVAPGTTVETFIEAYCAGSAGSCTGILDQLDAVVTGDGHSGFFQKRGDPMAFFLDGRTIYVVAVWREELDPSVLAYGGARALLDAFVSTLTLEAPSASPSPSP